MSDEYKVKKGEGDTQYWHQPTLIEKHRGSCQVRPFHRTYESQNSDGTSVGFGI